MANHLKENGKRIQRRLFSAILFQLNLLCSTKGLKLEAKADLTLQSFNLVCNFEETPWTNPLTFTYDGSPAGGCSSPPASCSSTIGSIAPSGSQSVTFTLNPGEILSKGNSEWKCNHGSDSAKFNATVIALCQNGDLKIEGRNIHVSCSCGYPSVEADIVYKDCTDEKSLGNLRLNLQSSSASCASDGRAMDFFSNITDFPSGTAKVCATIRTTAQITNPEPVCGTVVSDCGDSNAELFLRGFSIFLIVLGTTIVVIIILIFKKIGKKNLKATKMEVGVISAFIIIAFIVGLGLGFGLNENDKKNLSLGLGVGFGCLLSGSLIVIMIVIYFKFDSKKAPPKINVPSRFKEVSTFEKGKPIIIKIPFAGNPKPKVKWVRDKVELKGRNYVQEVTEHHAILTIKDANKEDDGSYRLTLENDLGTDFAVIKIQVNDDDERKGTPASTSNVDFTE